MTVNGHATDAGEQLALAGMVIPKEPNLNEELGVGPLIPNSTWSAWIGEDENGKVIANALQLVPIDELVLMRRKDGHARALLRLFTLPIRAAFATGEWVMPDGEEGGEEETDFCNKMWDTPPNAGGMSVTKSEFLKRALLALPDGFAAFEEVRHVPEDGPLAGKICIKKLAYRDVRTVKFVVDDKGEFTGIRQIASGLPKDISIAGEKVWYYSYQEEENPYYGVSLLEAAYHHYDVKRKLYYIAHIAAQHAAVPGRLGTVPRNPNPVDLKNFRDMLQAFAFNTSGVMKEGYSVQPWTGSSTFDFLAHINHQNSEMSDSVLASFLNDTSRKAIIDNSTTHPEADLFIMSLEAIMHDLEESWSTRLMPKYLDWNFGTKIYPRYKFGQLTDSARDAIKEIFTVVVTSSVLNSTPEFVRELEKKLSARLGLDIDYETIEAKEKQAAEEAQQQAQEQADQQAQMQQDAAAGMTPDGQPVAPQPPGGAPPVPGSPPMAGGPPQQIAASGSIDDLVAAAQQLFLLAPEGDLAEVDEL